MQQFFDNLASSTVAVVGDLMLDVYLQGEVSRISPEAPVPVVRLISERAVAGGAANVAANIAHLGGSVHLVGVAGPDEALASLSHLLRREGRIDISGIVIDAQSHTTKKTRLLGHHQQIARIDQERQTDPAADIQDAVINRAIAALDACDVAILSDYGKGALTARVLRSILDHAAKTGKPVIVDPKRRDMTVYRGATIISPNRAELALATGHACETDAEAQAAAAIAHTLTGADVLLTRSEKGMSYFPAHGDPIHLPTVAREVFDVSGAGDTVVAVLGVALAVGLPMSDAMKAANHAAGIVIGKVGTALVSHDELLVDLAAEGGRDIEDGRLLDLPTLSALRGYWRKRGLSVGLTNGCFDLLHPGHVALIRQAAESCDRLILALNTDASVQRLKGPSRPIQNDHDRAAVIGAVKGVAAVVLFDEDTPYEIIKALQPDLLVKGSDYTEETVVGADLVKASGGTILLAHLIDGKSTSSLIARR